MEIYKLLDRFELLYPKKEELADLRRAYIDQDLHSIFKVSSVDDDLRKAILEKNIHSIFRCVNNKRILGEIEDLRKAVVEQNLHSLFRLLHDNDDLRKAVLEDNLHSIFRLIKNDDLKGLLLNNNIQSLWRLLQTHVDTNFISAFKTMDEQGIEFDEDCFSRGQLKSKLWLIEELHNLSLDLGVVYLCAGWYGTLAVMLFESGLTLEKIKSFDIDPSCASIAELFNKPWVMDSWKFKATTKDINDIDFREHEYYTLKSDGETKKQWDIPTTIINTSCEHIPNFEKWYAKIPRDKIVVLQCNNYVDIDEHVNTHDTLESFAKQTPMDIELFSGELDLGKYKRFMRIGFK